MTDKYFAIDLKPEDLIAKAEFYYKTMDSLNLKDPIKKSYAYYYGRGEYASATGLSPGGSQGELTEAYINEYRSLLRYILTLVTSEKPAFDVRAVNTDYKSESQALVGEDVLNYYLKQKNLESILRDTTEVSLWSSEGFVELEWDVYAGEFYGVDPDGKSPIMKGDIKYSKHNVLSVVRDPFDNPMDPDWLIIIKKINKYELASRYPEHAEKIINSSNPRKYSGIWTNYHTFNSDMIEYMHFYHKKNVVLPKGKYAIAINDEILEAGPLPYDEIPVYRVAPATIDDTVFGYTPGFDILGLQEAGDDLFSALLSNNRTFARQLIAAQKDAGVNHKDISKGMTILELDAEDMNKAIKPLNLTRSAPESYQLLDKIEKYKEKLTGINEVIRGDPSSNLRSGNALALVAAQAIKYNATLQESYNTLVEKVGTATIKFLQQFAKAPRFYTVVGKHNKSMLKEFSADNIEKVDRVEVQRSSALTNTTAGRVEIADNLLQAGLIQRPQQYVAVLETGKIDPLVEAERTMLLNIKAENELLHTGETPFALITDNHSLHIQEHVAVLNDPELRRVPEVIDAVNQHIMEHQQLWLSAPPALLMATGQQPSPPPIMMPPQGPPQEGAPPPGPSGITQESMSPVEPGMSGAPGLPNLPTLPEGASNLDTEAFKQLNLQPPQ